MAHDLPGPGFFSAGGHAHRQLQTASPDCRTGEQAARTVLGAFLHEKLARYTQRNDPNQEVSSDLSAHLHFGMISAQRVALETLAHGHPGEQTDAFLEELIVRRELADNFCLHTPDYDSVDGFPAWAAQSLYKHRNDPRPALYSPEEFENARTHDPLWNAAQTQMLLTGKMHGYLRMYWAKKSWNGRRLRPTRCIRPFASTTATVSMAATPTATQALPGPSAACMTAAGPSARFSARSDI